MFMFKFKNPVQFRSSEPLKYLLILGFVKIAGVGQKSRFQVTQGCTI